MSYAATDTIRQRLFDAVATVLRTILEANGYKTDLGSRVFECRATRPLDTELPALNLWDLDEDSKWQLMPGTHEHTINFQIYVLQAGENSAEFIRKAIADVHRAIGADTKWGGLAHKTLPGRTTYEIDQETRRLTGEVRIEFQIVYRATAWDMTAQD